MINSIVVFGGRYFIFLLLAAGFIVLLIKDGKGTFWQGVFAVLLSLGAAEALKNFFPSLRPFEANGTLPLLGFAEGASFPSSHTAVAAALAATLWFKSKSWGTVFFVGALLVALARVLGGVHFWYDVLAGLAIGVTAGLFSHHFEIFWKKR